MGIVRKQLKNGRIAYQNEKGKFVKPKEWIKEQYGNIGTKRGSQINYNGLTSKEKRSYNAIKTSKSLYRYKGTYQNKLLNPLLMASGYDVNKDLKNFLSLEHLDTLKSVTQTLPKDGMRVFDRDSKRWHYYETKSGTIMDIARDLQDKFREGYSIEVTDENGVKHTGHDAVEFLRDWEMKKAEAEPAEKIRFEHRYQINIANKTVVIDLEKTVVRRYGTP